MHLRTALQAAERSAFARQQGGVRDAEKQKKHCNPRRVSLKPGKRCPGPGAAPGAAVPAPLRSHPFPPGTRTAQLRAHSWC